MRRHFATELLEDRHDDAAHADRWILSYADFITLLFAFFVVMYSISSVNDGKLSVLSASLAAVFQDPQVAAALAERRRLRDGTADAEPANVHPDGLDGALDGAFGDGAWLSDPLALDPADLGAVVAALVAARPALAVSVRESDDWTEIELPAGTTFGADGRLDPASAA
ncbi:MAG: flagellar motor protein MotB, partial [Gammaproteobacteria bacterium]